MGKKGKKSGGKKGKKKGGKNKQNAGDEMSWKEALYAYQINIKETAKEDMKYEIRALEEKHERHKERNERLKMEQEYYLQNLLKQAKEFGKKIEEEVEVDKNEVIEKMMAALESRRQEDRDIAALKEQIARMESEMVREDKQVTYWTDYRNKGQHEHKTQIELLQHELVDMQDLFSEMSGHIEMSLETAKSEIGKNTDDSLNEQKKLASEKAMATMDKSSRQEVLDNDWLKREVAIHQKETDELIQLVEQLEKDNLEVMSELFECTIDDLKISRNFFLTQFSDSENLDETSILEMDLSKLSIHEQRKQPPMILPAPPVEETKRPKSATHKYIEDKVFNLLERAKAGAEESSDESDESEYYGENDIEDSEQGDPYNNYFQFDEEDFDDYLKLGPLEMKLLNIQGIQMPIYKPKTPSKEEVRAKQFKPDEWPVTNNMLQEVVSDRQ